MSRSESLEEHKCRKLGHCEFYRANYGSSKAKHCKVRNSNLCVESENLEEVNQERKGLESVHCVLEGPHFVTSEVSLVYEYTHQQTYCRHHIQVPVHLFIDAVNDADLEVVEAGEPRLEGL